MDETTKRDRRVLIITVIVCALLQLVVAPNIAIGLARPNFLLIAVVCIAVFCGSRTGCIAGGIAGIVMDLVGTAPFGAYLIVLALVGYVSGLVARGLIIESWVMTLVVLAICAIASEFVVCAVMAILGQNDSFFASLYLVMLPSALYDIIFACICFPLVKHFMAPARDRLANNTKLR